MTPETITADITASFESIQVVLAYGDAFFYYAPDPETRSDLYFATLKTTDDHFDHRSALARMGAFRLNMEVGIGAFQRLFGRPADVALADEAGRYDYTAVNELLPHPLYAGAGWVCILNPNKQMFATVVAPLLSGAYDRAVEQYALRAKNPRG